METRGRVNIYTCRICGKEHVTINLADGVTPMFIQCRNWVDRCEGTAVSAGYRVDQNLMPEFVWYKPTEEQIKKLDKGL